MPLRMKIPVYAKKSALKGLELRKTKGGGLTKKEADKLKIQSGVERAKQIIKNKYLYEEDLKSIGKFYIRFRNCNTPKCEVAHLLWGGRRFSRMLAKIYFNFK